LYKSYLDGTPVAVQPPAEPSFQSFTETWLAKRGRTEQDYLPVGAMQDTATMRHFAVSSRADPGFIRPASGCATGRSRVPEQYTPTAYTTVADRYAVDAAARARSIMSDLTALESTEQSEIQKQSLKRMVGNIAPTARDSLESAKTREASERVTRHMGTGVHGLNCKHMASDSGDTHRRVVQYVSPASQRWMQQNMKAETSAEMSREKLMGLLESRGLEDSHKAFTGTQGGGLYASREYDAARNLYSSACKADPSSVTYSKGPAASRLLSGDVRGAMAETKRMQELAVMPRLHPRAGIGLSA